RDPEYRDTILESLIPIPSVETCPPLQQFYQNRPNRNHEGRHSNHEGRYSNHEGRYSNHDEGRYSNHEGRHSNHEGSGHRGSDYRDKRDSNYRDSNNTHHNPSHHSLPPNPFAAPHPTHNVSDARLNPKRSKIELPNQKVSFLACQINEPISGLNMKIGPILEPDYNQFCMKEIVESLLEEKVGLTGIKRYDPVKDLEFRFADLCGGPGGFAEYLLWRKNSLGERIFGWGITLTGEQDYDLNRFNPDSMVNFCFKRVYGKDKTGDLYKEENINQFVNIVMEDTKGVGVDLITADG
ncbi:2656_t:CDS:2, partial [Acaulospora morrowiae]